MSGIYAVHICHIAMHTVYVGVQFFIYIHMVQLGSCWHADFCSGTKPIKSFLCFCSFVPYYSADLCSQHTVCPETNLLVWSLFLPLVQHPNCSLSLFLISNIDGKKRHQRNQSWIITKDPCNSRFLKNYHFLFYIKISCFDFSRLLKLIRLWNIVDTGMSACDMVRWLFSMGNASVSCLSAWSAASIM